MQIASFLSGDTRGSATLMLLLSVVVLLYFVSKSIDLGIAKRGSDPSRSSAKNNYTALRKKS